MSFRPVAFAADPGGALFKRLLRLAGGGRFRFAFRDGTPRVDGRLDATAAKPRPLPRRCSRLR
jgi:hypothetical protein